MVYKPAAVIIAAAALNVASTVAIPIGDNSIVTREPEPLFGLGAVAKLGSKVMHKVGHKKAKHAAHGAEAANDAANTQQSNRRSLDSDEFDELVARDEELETREPEPLFGLGAVAKLGSKVMHKVGHKGKHAAHGAEAVNEATQQSNRRSLDADEFDELFARDEFDLDARDFDELDELVARDEELEAREPEPEPEPLFGLGAVAKLGSKVMHKVGHKKAKHAAHGAEAANDAANTQQSNRRSLDSDEFDELVARDEELETREPEPLFGLGAVAKLGSKVMHKVGHKGKHAAHGAEAANEATQQSNRRSLDADEFDELFARNEIDLDTRDFDELDELVARDEELETREPEPEPEPLFGLGAVAKLGSKVMHKVGHKKAKHAAHGAEAANDAANTQQTNRRSLEYGYDLDELD